MNKSDIPSAVVRRLPRYYRYLERLAAEDVARISSSELGEQMGLTASQVRQDFNCFGGFGQQGYGYSVPVLLARFADILGINALKKGVLLGVGNLGRALLQNFTFEKRGVRLVAAFDTDPDIIGRQYGALTVLPMDDLAAVMAAEAPEIAVLTIPKAAAGRVARQLIGGGIKGIWNFTSIDLQLQNPEIPVEDVHFGDTLATLSFRIDAQRGQEA